MTQQEACLGCGLAKRDDQLLWRLSAGLTSVCGPPGAPLGVHWLLLSRWWLFDDEGVILSVERQDYL